MCFNEPGWLGLQLRREGDIYSIPTTYSTQSEKDTRNVSKGGGIISDQPTGRCTVPTVHLRSGTERIRCLKLLRQHNSVLVTKHFHKYCQCIIVLGLKFDSISTSSDNFFFHGFSISDHADSGAPPHNGNSGSEHQSALQPVPVVVPAARAAAVCRLAG